MPPSPNDRRAIPAPIPIFRQQRLPSGGLASGLAPPSPRHPQAPSPRHLRLVAAEDRQLVLDDRELALMDHYGLRLPPTWDHATVLLHRLDPLLPFYLRTAKRTLDLPSLLPYAIEPPAELARYLAHIVSHLYIALQLMDLSGLLPILARDLAELRENPEVDEALAAATHLSEDDTDINMLNDDQALEDGDEASDSDDEDEDDEHLGDDDDELMSIASSTAHSRTPGLSAAIGVRHWTNELRVWMKMKYEMPVRLRALLARVYYAVCLSHGQVPDKKMAPFLAMFLRLVHRKHRLLRHHGLRLDWQPLLEQFAVGHFPLRDSLVEPLENKETVQLMRLAMAAANFFEPGAVHPLMLHTLAQFLLANASHCALVLGALMPLTFDPANDVRRYLPLVFAVWELAIKVKNTSAHFVLFLGAACERYFQLVACTENTAPGSSLSAYPLTRYGMLSEHQFVFVVLLLLNSLRINTDVFGLPAGGSSPGPGAATVMVYSINGEQLLVPGGVLDQIATVANAVHSYVHPSNAGPWTKHITRFVELLVLEFHKRYNLEQCENDSEDNSLRLLPPLARLTPAVVERFVEIVLPLVTTGIQSKLYDAAELSTRLLSALAHLLPTQVLLRVLPDLYDLFEATDSLHRVDSAVRQAGVLMRYLVATPVFRCHAIRLLLMSVVGVDSNDLFKTLAVCNLFTIAALFIPFADLSNGLQDALVAMHVTETHLEWLRGRNAWRSSESEPLPPLEIDEETETQALVLSTSAFGELLKLFTTRMFALLENIPEASPNGMLPERAVLLWLPKAVLQVVDLMLDAVFKLFGSLLLEFVGNNVFHSAVSAVGPICRSVVKRDRKYLLLFVRVCAPRIHDELNDGAALHPGIDDVPPRDRALLWYITVLSCCVEGAGAAVLLHALELMLVIEHLQRCARGPVGSEAGLLVLQLLYTTTTVWIEELLLVLPRHVEQHGYSPSLWGAFQFDPHRFDPNVLDFVWHVPSEEEVAMAVSVFEQVVDSGLRRIHEATESQEATGADDIRTQLSFISAAMSGIAVLVDPAYHLFAEKANMDNEQRQVLHARLLVLKRLQEGDRAAVLRLLSPGEWFAETAPGSAPPLRPSLVMPPDVVVGGETPGSATPVPEIVQNDTGGEMAIDDPEVEEDGDISGTPRGSEDLRPQTPAPATSPLAPGTPGADAVLLFINQLLHHRELKLYWSGYYFGATAIERCGHPMYTRLHQARARVGTALQLLELHLAQQTHHDVLLYRAWLHATCVWLCDVGRDTDRGLPTTLYRYLWLVQRLPGMRKPFTRPTVAARLESYHRMRAGVRLGHRVGLLADRVLVARMAQLCCLPYADVASTAAELVMGVLLRVLAMRTTFLDTVMGCARTAASADDPLLLVLALLVLSSRNVLRYISRDSNRLELYCSLAFQLMGHTHHHVAQLAEKMVDRVSQYVLAPLSVCVVDSAAFALVRPPGVWVDSTVSAVRNAKHRKRAVIMAALVSVEELALRVHAESLHWRLQHLSLRLVLLVLRDLEVVLRGKLLAALAAGVASKHPSISGTAVRGVNGVLSKAYDMGLCDYKLDRMTLLQLSPHVSVVVETAGAASDWFAKEMANTSSPQWFVDTLPANGWLAWDETFLALRVEPYGFHVNLHDEASLRTMGEVMTREWLVSLTSGFVSANDQDAMFQGSHMFLYLLVVQVVVKGFAPHLTLLQFVQVLEQVYEADDKGVHVVVCEMCIGMLVASRGVDAGAALVLQESVVATVHKVLGHDLSPDNRGVWQVFSRFVSMHLDPRRLPAVQQQLLGFEVDKGLDAAFVAATRVLLWKTFLKLSGWRTDAATMAQVLSSCFANIDHPYQAVREQLAGTMTVAVCCQAHPSYPSVADLVEAVPSDGSPFSVMELPAEFQQQITKAFEQVEEWRVAEVVGAGLTLQEVVRTRYIAGARTLLYWVRQMASTLQLLLLEPLVALHIWPFLLRLSAMKDVCTLANIRPLRVFLRLAQLPFAWWQVDGLIALLEDTAKHEGAGQQQALLIVLGVVQVVYFRHLVAMLPGQRERLFGLALSMCEHRHHEVRESAATTLTGLIHALPPHEVGRLVVQVQLRCTKVLVLRRSKKTGVVPSDAQLHGATLGLGALVNAFPYALPPPVWVPQALALLARYASGAPGVVGKTAKDTLSGFKKTRQDTWGVDSKAFTQEQLEDLEGVLWKSYFI